VINPKSFFEYPTLIGVISEKVDFGMLEKVNAASVKLSD
jgi:hypothetical protein